ncbi:glutathione S-transferase N-terminal domain-containing protein [Bowmanella dokdonensis]|uniref:Glutathione S-transferase n=1 Tax=Bowmanella dokdonensis TaxID=751969 RepID=A0A939DKM8_9ALTE|nr:glutathione S-transferase [Bowmanella dokdonensis]
MARTLYVGNYNASSWAFRAWLSLKEAGIYFSEQMVDIRRPQRWENLARIGEFSPPAAVPVLVDDGTVIYDSLAIMEYANEMGGGVLLPGDIKRRAKARSFMAWQHSTFGRICPCLSFESSFYRDKKNLSTDEQGAIEKIYTLWQHALQDNEGDYLVGDYSLADMAFVPSVIRFSSHYQPDERWPLVRAWMDRLLTRPHVADWMGKAYDQEPIYLPGYRNDP